MDPELKALTLIERALKRLPTEAARDRVLEYVYARHNEALRGPGQSPSVPTGLEPYPVAKAK